MKTAEILAMLPWRPPFLMIDRMIECEPHGRIVTEKKVTSADGSWLPAVMLLEAMGQSAALLYRLSYVEQRQSMLPLLGFLSATFQGSAMPGQSVRFHVHSIKMTRSGGVFTGRALLQGGGTLAEAELAFKASTEEN